MFTKIDMATWVRKPYFDYYINKITARYQLTVQADITEFLKIRRAYNKKMYPTIMYAVTSAINRHDEFRLSYDENGNLGIYDTLSPSYTIFHEDDHTFSDIWTEWDFDFKNFYDAVQSDMATYKNAKGIKAKSNAPSNIYPISMLPWLSFSGYAIDTSVVSHLFTPIVTIGKYYEDAGCCKIPLAVYVNHAVADGYHTSMLIEDIILTLNRAEEWIVK